MKAGKSRRVRKVLRAKWSLMGASVLLATVISMASLPSEAQTRHAIPNLAGKILTVRGPIEPHELGPTLTHEHVFIEFQRTAPQTATRSATQAEIYQEPLTLHNLSAVRMGIRNADDAIIGSFDDVLSEVLAFKELGGNGIVDLSNIGLGRDAKALLRLANATDMNVVMGAGWYVAPFHPLDMTAKTVEELTDIVVRDITIGVDGTDVRSGVIGEVGVACGSGQITENEMKATRASARAARITGAPMIFHCGGFREEKFKILDMLEQEGVDLRRVTMGHSNGLANDIAFAKRLLARGVMIEFDYLGATGSPFGWLDTTSMNDAEVARGVAELVKLGYANRIVLSHDICTKIQLKKWGGFGYTYITKYFVPALKGLGVSDEVIHKITVDNPRKVLTFGEPKP